MSRGERIEEGKIMARLARRVRLVIGSLFSYCPQGSQRGQAMTEYIVALAFAVCALIAFSTSMQIAVFRYLQPIYFWVGLPIP